nr:uncharacterized protein LOC129383545 isoform X1 [Dermacentor andersoni]
MAIYPEPPIGNLTLLHAIAYARQQKGLHIYFDEPPAKALSLSTPIQQIQKCNCSDMNITFVLRALEDKPQYIVGIEDDKDTTAMEAGVGGPSFCFMGRAKDGTWKDNDCSQEAFVAKKDDFLTTKFLISNKDGFGKGISQVAHLLRDQSMCFMSSGGYAVMKGRFKTENPQINGIAIGIGKGHQHMYKTYAYGNSEPATFMIYVNDLNTTVSDNRTTQTITTKMPGDEFVYLAFINMEVEDMEIHSGRRPHD